MWEISKGKITCQQLCVNSFNNNHPWSVLDRVHKSQFPIPGHKRAQTGMKNYMEEGRDDSSGGRLPAMNGRVNFSGRQIRSFMLDGRYSRRLQIDLTDYKNVMGRFHFLATLLNAANLRRWGCRWSKQKRRTHAAEVKGCTKAHGRPLPFHSQSVGTCSDVYQQC